MTAVLRRRKAEEEKSTVCSSQCRGKYSSARKGNVAIAIALLNQQLQKKNKDKIYNKINYTYYLLNGFWCGPADCKYCPTFLYLQPYEVHAIIPILQMRTNFRKAK